MPKIKVKAHYGNIDSLDEAQSPDIYKIDKKNYSRPLDTFIISKKLDGTVLSVYGDKIWDLTPYRLVGHTGTSRVNFSHVHEEHILDTKWVIFILLFLADTGRASGLSLTSVLYYMKVLKALSKFSSINKRHFFDYFSHQELTETLIEHLHTKTLLQGFRGVALHISSIGEDKTQIKVSIKTIALLTQEKIKKLPSDSQHPVIPPRIYNELLEQLNIFILEFKTIEEKFFLFFQEVVSNESFARSAASNHKLGFYKAEDIKPDFLTETSNYNLDEYFYKYGITNLPKLLTFIVQLQHACRLRVHIYSGMRNGEALNLKLKCLEINKSKSGTIYIIKGETSKLVGQKKIDSWVTSPEGCEGIKIAEKIASIIGSKVGLTLEEIPLFISPGYVFKKIDPSTFSPNDPITVSKTSSRVQEFYELINRDIFTIKKQDIQFLMLIDPFRAWNTEKNFQEDDIWRFTIHQFRRSLAYFVSQSSLVSLPSLKRQLKHITHDMTLYYCQSKIIADNDSNFKKISEHFNRKKYKADACVYLKDVLESNETLYGASGKHYENSVKNAPELKVYLTKRTELETKFKKGEIAYKTTPLGACTTITPCMKRATLEIAACVSCDKAIIKKSKLEKVIEIQKIFLDEFEDKDSVEFRTEKAELDALEDFHSNISKQEDN